MSSPANRPLESFSGGQLADLRLNRKWLLSLIALGLLSLVALFTLGDRHQTMALIAKANWLPLLAAFLIHYSGFAVRGYRWQRLLADMDHEIPYYYCTALLLAGWFVSAIIPARAGDIMRVGVLRSPANEGSSRMSVPVADGLSSVVLERILDMVAILLLGAGFGFLVLQTRLPAWVLTLYGTVIALLGVLGLALLVLPRVWEWLGALSQKSFWQKLIGFGSDTTAKLSILLQSPKTALALIGLSLYIWLCDALLLWLVMTSLGEFTEFSPAAFVALTVDVIAAVPLTPGGIMQIEGAYAALLGLMDLPVVKLPAIILLTRAISYWSFLLFSGIVTLIFFWAPSKKQTIEGEAEYVE